MEIMRPSCDDEYLLSFWTRQREKDGEFPPPEKRLETILGKYPYKFPCDGKKEVAWHICELSSVTDLERLWLHKSGDWLDKHGFKDSQLWLKDLARAALKSQFFHGNPHTGQRKNYDKWKKAQTLKGQLDDHERPLLVQYPYLIDIVDGFGRLLPYLALVYEGLEFHPFQAYLAVPRYP